MRPSVFKKFSWTLFGRIVAAGFQMLGIILLARWEDISSFGIVASALAFGTVIHAFIDFGLSTFLIKERALDSSSNKIDASIILTKKISTIFILCGTLLLLVLGILFETFYLSLIPLVFWIAYERRSEQLLGLLIADGNNKKATQLLTLRRFLSLLGFLALYFFTPLEPTLSYTLGLFAGSYISYRYTLSVVHPSINTSAIPLSLRQMFTHTAPFWINSLFAQLRNIDVALVSALSGPVHGAYFGFINRSVGPLNMVATSMASVILPSVAKSEISTHQYIRYLLIATAISSVPYLTIFFAADYLIPIFLSEKYLPTILLAKIISIGLVFFSASSIVGSILQGVHEQKKVATVNIATTSIYLLLLIPLTLHGDSVYAAYTLDFFFTLRFATMFYFLYRHVNEVREAQENL